eukprot:scaffold55877_cov26-Tisochrysis_lutea.AAC.1
MTPLTSRYCSANTTAHCGARRLSLRCSAPASPRSIVEHAVSRGDAALPPLPQSIFMDPWPQLIESSHDHEVIKVKAE